MTNGEMAEPAGVGATASSMPVNSPVCRERVRGFVEKISSAPFVGRLAVPALFHLFAYSLLHPSVYSIHSAIYVQHSNLPHASKLTQILPTSGRLLVPPTFLSPCTFIDASHVLNPVLLCQYWFQFLSGHRTHVLNIFASQQH